MNTTRDRLLVQGKGSPAGQGADLFKGPSILRLEKGDTIASPCPKSPIRTNYREGRSEDLGTRRSSWCAAGVEGLLFGPLLCAGGCKDPAWAKIDHGTRLQNLAGP